MNVHIQGHKKHTIFPVLHQCKIFIHQVQQLLWPQKTYWALKKQLLWIKKVTGVRVHESVRKGCPSAGSD